MKAEGKLFTELVTFCVRLKIFSDLTFVKKLQASTRFSDTGSKCKTAYCRHFRVGWANGIFSSEYVTLL